MRRYPTTRSLAAAVGAALVLAACSGAGGEEAGQDDPGGDASPATAASGGPLVVNIVGAPSTLDPHVACGAADMHLMDNLYARLVDYGEQPGPVDGTTSFDPTEMEPSLAESWEVSDDGLVYTFVLREASFPSGDPIDADAVKYSLERSETIGRCGGSSFLNNGINDPYLLESVEAPDPRTVVITLSMPLATFPENLAQPGAAIVDPAVIEEHGGVVEGEANEHFANNQAGASGAYILEQYEPGTSARLTANPDYFGEEPAFPIVEVNFVGSSSTLLLQASNGEADVTIGMSKEGAAALEEDGCCTVVPFPAAMALDMAMNWNAEPFDDPTVREALTYAFPYEDLLASVGRGYGELFYGPFPPDMDEHNPDLSRPRPHDPDRARELLAEAGVPEPFAFSLSIRADLPEMRPIAGAVQGALADIDVEVDVREVSPAEWSDMLYGGDFEAVMLSGGPAIVNGGYYLSYEMWCDGPFNVTGICVPEADEHWLQAREEADPDVRRQHWDGVIEEWVAASPKVKLWGVPEMVVVNQERVPNLYYALHANFARWG